MINLLRNGVNLFKYSSPGVRTPSNKIHLGWFNLANSERISSTHKIENQFGFEKIDSGQKQSKGLMKKLLNHLLTTNYLFAFVKFTEKNLLNVSVDNVFKSVADNYDLMNDAMSFGIHRIWKDIFIDRLSPTPGTKLLDVAGGTGDISFRFLKSVRNKNKNSFVTVCDINAKMLEVGRKRSSELDYCKDRIEWIEGNAESLPFGDETYDAYTIAFGIRNVTHIEKVLIEAYRVLRPGGRFLCLEFSEVSNECLRFLYDAYSFQVIPAMGELIAGDWQAYKYLVESIRNFPNQENFKELIENAGFRMVDYENLTFGVVAIHSGFKL